MTIAESAELIAAIGIIISLIYAGIGLRRNTREVRAATYADVTGSFADMSLEFARSPEMTELMLRGTDDFDTLNRNEKARMRFIVMAFARRFEIAYYQRKLGILTKEDWVGIEGDVHSVFSMPGWVAAWRLVENRSSVEFRAFVEKIIKEEAGAKG